METTIETLREAVRTRQASGGVFEVAPDLVCLPFSVVNAYAVGSPGAASGTWVLVDAALWTSAGHILRECAARFGPESRPAAIVLTHGHFDHVGALRQLLRVWGDVPVYAHRMELPYLTGRSSYPPPDPTVGGGAMTLLSPLYPRGPVDLGNHVLPLPEDGTIPGMPGWRWIATPGHTPGHVALWRESDRTLLVGDAFVTTRQESLIWALTQPEEIHGPPAYFTPNWVDAQESVQRLASLEPEVVATGHGRPLSGEGMRDALRTLAREFGLMAVPRHGRYVERPAVADERGVISVPPPAVDLRWFLAAGVGLGLVAAALMARPHLQRRRRPDYMRGITIDEHDRTSLFPL